MKTPTWTIGVQYDSFHLALYETPLWSRLTSHAYEWFTHTLLRGPCCYKGLWGRVYDLLPNRSQWDGDGDEPEGRKSLRDYYDTFAFWVCNNKLANIEITSQNQILSVPLTEEQAMVIAPDFVKTVREVWSD